MILNILLSMHNRTDYWTWHHEKSGDCIVQSVYRLLVETKRRREDWLEHRSASSNMTAVNREWKDIWKLNVPGKIKNFVWRLARYSISMEHFPNLQRSRG